MKIECCKLYSENLKEKNVFNNDLRDHFKIGLQLLVYGLTFNKNILYYYIFDEDHIFEVPSQLFKIIDSRVSKYWKLRIDDENEYKTLWPSLFYDEAFIENMMEREEKERKEFEELKILMEKEYDYV